MEEINERIEILMMDALDGEITPADRAELNAYLQNRPALAEEWAMMQTIDTLFQETPVVVPEVGFAQRTLDQMDREWAMMAEIDALLTEVPAMLPSPNFTQRTLAQLPNSKARVWAMGSLFWLLFLGGLLPIAGIFWLSGGAPLPNIAFLGAIGQSLDAIFGSFQIMLGGVWQLVRTLGQEAIQSPPMWGAVLSMTGIMLLWSGVYGQMMRRQPQPVFVTAR
jgi:anti-sigma factor RsiW